VIWHAIHSAVGWRVTLIQTSFSALQLNDDKNVEQVEANGRGNEQVHGDEIGRMVAQEGAPPRGGWSASLDHILRDAGLSDLKAELEQLAVDARRSPQRIVNAHPSDQRAQVCVDLRPTSKGAGFPTPVPAEARLGAIARGSRGEQL